jgi:hypothetical protein
MGKLSRGCESLQSLVLYGCPSVSVYGLQQLVMRCKQLTSISMSHATDQGLAVLAGADKLNTVRLNGSNVTSMCRWWLGCVKRGGGSNSIS